MSTGLIIAIILLLLSTLSLIIDRQNQQQMYDQLSDSLAISGDLYKQTGLDIRQIVKRVTDDILWDNVNVRVISGDTSTGRLELECTTNYYNLFLHKSAVAIKEVQF